MRTIIPISNSMTTSDQFTTFPLTRRLAILAAAGITRGQFLLAVELTEEERLVWVGYRALPPDYIFLVGLDAMQALAAHSAQCSPNISSSSPS